MKQKLIYILLILLGLVGVYITLSLTFPDYMKHYPILLLLLIIDYYVWGLIKKKVFTYKKWAKVTTVLIYWLPFTMLLGSVITTAYIPSSDWNIWISKLLFGTIISFFIAKALMAIMLLFSDLLRFLKWIWGMISPKRRMAVDGQKISRSKFLEDLALVTGGLIVGTMFTGMFKWVHDFKVTELSLKLPKLTKLFDGYRIVQISDFHLGTWSSKAPVIDVVEQINNLNPDLIVFTGDLVNYKTDEAYRFQDILQTLKAKDGIYAILGNHDYGDYINWPDKNEKKRNLEALLNFYHQINWKLLRNENAIIRREDEELALIGVENWSVNKRFPKYGNIIKASKGIGKSTPKILLSHDPSHWDAEVSKKHHDILLTLAGHTHGFQFGVEVPGIRWSPAQYLYKQWAGLYQNEDQNQYLYVNRGLGSIGYPGRVGILPEITVIELQTV